MTAAFFVYCTLLVAVLLAALPLATLSAGARSQDGPAFDVLDRDRNGFIDAREASWASGLTGAFGRLDANRDGKLDRVEFAQW